MTNEILSQATNLRDKIAELTKQKEWWLSAEKLSFVSLRSSNFNGDVHMNIKYVDFDIVQTLALSKINKEIDQLVSEYTSL